MRGRRDPLTERVICGAIEVHRSLGPGLLEVVYRRCLAHELRMGGLRVEAEIALPVEYRGERVECGFRVDLIVDRKLILEVKAVRELHPIHSSQLLTYLRLSGLRVGLLLNFHAPTLVDGVRRVVSNPPASGRNATASAPIELQARRKP